MKEHLLSQVEKLHKKYELLQNMTMYIDITNIDLDSLRNDLIDHFGTAASYMPFAMADVVKVQNASYRELIRIAEDNGFDIGKYIKIK